MHRKATPRILTFVVSLVALGLLGPPAGAHGGRPCLAPSGDDDTGALQAALDSCAGAESKCVVRLCEGVFETAPLRVRNFRGVLRGAGSERTVLQALPELVVNPNPGGYWRDDPLGELPWPYLLQFIGGEGEVRDLALEVPDPGDGLRPTQGWTESGGDRYEMAGALLITGREPVDFALKGVRVVGGEYDNGAFEDLTLFSGIAIRGLLPKSDPTGEFPVDPLPGRIRLTDSHIVGPLVGTSLGELESADVLMTRNRVEAFIAVDLLDASRSRVRILRNDWDVQYVGAQLWLNIDDEPSTDNLFLVAQNQGTIDNFFGAGAGIFFQDPWGLPEPGSSALGVVSNDLTVGTAGELAYRGISVQGAGRLRITGNSIRGGAATGIRVDDNTGCLVAWNDQGELETLEGPHVALGLDTTECLAVVGRDDIVVDDGTANRVIRFWWPFSLWR